MEPSRSLGGKDISTPQILSRKTKIIQSVGRRCRSWEDSISLGLAQRGSWSSSKWACKDESFRARIQWMWWLNSFSCISAKRMNNIINDISRWTCHSFLGWWASYYYGSVAIDSTDAANIPCRLLARGTLRTAHKTQEESTRNILKARSSFSRRLLALRPGSLQ